MQNKPFFSIVMPVYGVEKYLRACVSCLLSQTDPDFELILTDDCSPDGSGEICDALAAEDERIRVIHLDENKGLSGARNAGFEQVSGEYVLFLDSDDEFAPDMLEKIRAANQKNPADVTVFSLEEEFFDARGNLSYTNTVKADGDYYFDAPEKLRPYIIELEEKTLYGYAWNKAYRVDYLRTSGVKFEAVTLIEDITFNVAAFENINSLNVLSAVLYKYKKRINSSLTNKFIEDYFSLSRRRVELVCSQQRRFGLSGEKSGKVLAKIYARYVVSALQRNASREAGLSHAERRKWLADLYADSLWRELSPYLPSGFSSLGIMCFLLKHRLSEAALFCGRGIYLVRKTLPVLFSRLKGRAQ